MRSIKRNDSINIVPFIDVLLVLLAIVFVIANFIALGKIEVDLPFSSSKEVLKNVRHTIVITDDSRFYIDDVEIKKDVVASKISIFSEDDSITVVSDKKSVYEDFIFIVDILKAKQLEKISMAVKK